MIGYLKAKVIYPAPVRFRVIYRQFLVVIVGTVALYSAVNWAATMRNFRMDRSDDVTDKVLPGAAALLGAILLWSRAKAFTNRGRNSARGFFVAATFAGIWLSTAMAQSYLRSQTGQLTALSRIGQIRDVPRTKYYTVDAGTTDPSQASFSSTWSTGSKGHSLILRTFFIAPILDPEAGQKPAPSTWLGATYIRQTSNPRSNQESQHELEVFAVSRAPLFRQLTLRQFTYFERLKDGGNGAFLNRLASDRRHTAPEDTFVLVGRSSPFENRAGTSLLLTLGILVALGAAGALLTALGEIDDRGMQALISRNGAPRSRSPFVSPDPKA